MVSIIVINQYKQKKVNTNCYLHLFPR